MKGRGIKNNTQQIGKVMERHKCKSCGKGTTFNANADKKRVNMGLCSKCFEPYKTPRFDERSYAIQKMREPLLSGGFRIIKRELPED